MDALKTFRRSLSRGLENQCNVLEKALTELSSENERLRQKARRLEIENNRLCRAAQQTNVASVVDSVEARTSTRDESRPLPTETAHPAYREANTASLPAKIDQLVRTSPELGRFLQRKAKEYQELRDAHLRLIDSVREYHRRVTTNAEPKTTQGLCARADKTSERQRATRNATLALERQTAKDHEPSKSSAAQASKPLNCHLKQAPYRSSPAVDACANLQTDDKAIRSTNGINEAGLKNQKRGSGRWGQAEIRDETELALPLCQGSNDAKGLQTRQDITQSCSIPGQPLIKSEQGKGDQDDCPDQHLSSIPTNTIAARLTCNPRNSGHSAAQGSLDLDVVPVTFLDVPPEQDYQIHLETPIKVGRSASTDPQNLPSWLHFPSSRDTVIREDLPVKVSTKKRARSREDDRLTRKKRIPKEAVVILNQRLSQEEEHMTDVEDSMPRQNCTIVPEQQTPSRDLRRTSGASNRDLLLVNGDVAFWGCGASSVSGRSGETVFQGPKGPGKHQGELSSPAADTAGSAAFSQNMGITCLTRQDAPTSSFGARHGSPTESVNHVGDEKAVFREPEWLRPTKTWKEGKRVLGDTRESRCQAPSRRAQKLLPVTESVDSGEHPANSTAARSIEVSSEKTRAGPATATDSAIRTSNGAACSDTSDRRGEGKRRALSPPGFWRTDMPNTQEGQFIITHVDPIVGIRPVES